MKRRFHLKRREARELDARLAAKFGILGLLGDEVEVIELGDGRELLLAKGELIAFRTGGEVFPHLAAVGRFKLKRVAVDAGAVPYVAGGADIMAPGVVSADEGISQGDVVVVVDERHGKPLAIGSALVSGEAMRAPKGKVIKNLYHVGDPLWRLGKEIG